MSTALYMNFLSIHEFNNSLVFANSFNSSKFKLSPSAYRFNKLSFKLKIYFYYINILIIYIKLIFVSIKKI